ncbi:DNA alkylation repair protein [Legionella feeleii]|uniref:DNA alkylation repair enzyme n=1 Tax=Legionella feeleii TaxID=453 RepID=A0A0W0THC2_9GAMM|nr:DNA alkylation repair protein [Legionella feeleii]KTC94988.1 DNA alkylation repair enzyme [Legionella feeleii]SPX61041.1 DNA alkylation repair protein [Legionella feeleii]
MSELIVLKKQLLQHENKSSAVNIRKFFKNSQDDIFLGVSTVLLRQIAKHFITLSLTQLLELMSSDVHEERAIAYIILCLKFKKADEKEQLDIFNFYIDYRHTIRDWDGVDGVAPYVVGPYLLNREKTLLYTLANSKSLWDRRIAIISTWWFIRQNEIEDALKLAEILLSDQEDLIHKATGWMLREVGKRNIVALKRFLELHHARCSRTTLRYAIEKFSPEERQYYLNLR